MNPIQPLSCLRALGLALGLALSHAASAQTASPADAPAWGLIVGFRADSAPTPAVREPAAWQQQARQGRERMQRVAREAGVAVQGVGQAGGAQLMRFGQALRGQALQEAMRRVRLHPDVAWVEPNVRLQRLQTIPTDPGWGQQWHLMDSASGGTAAIGMPAAWSISTGVPGTTVAVLDTGILPHADLTDRTHAGYDFVSEVEYAGDGNGRDNDPTDPGDWVTPSGNNPAVQQLVDNGTCEPTDSSWHGTFVTGQLVATANNQRGIAGLNWAAQVLPVRVSGACGALLSDLLDGMRWAAGLPVDGVPMNPQPARIINLSFGGSGPCSSSPAYQSAIDEVTALGALVVVAGGNQGTALTRPADCQRVLAVGAVGQEGLKASYSNWGTAMGLMAPGGTLEKPLYSTSNAGLTVAAEGENFYSLLQGTSFAAPLASGVASLMLAINPALPPAQLVERLRSAARPWSNLPTVPGYPACRLNPVGGTQGVCRCTTQTCGPGLLDAAQALQLAHNPAALIETSGTVALGATLTLDGSASAAIAGSQISRYQWTQTQGPSVALTDPNAAQTRVTLARSGVYAFELSVTDSAGRTGRASLPLEVAGTDGDSGGGGANGLLWGAALWAWVLALLWFRGRPARRL